ncbi:hypothetical protein RJ639_034082 [Escallonia herrerae]|uniref:Uncharacterized protein n=1 Tax=Escallonia herrerae TaxID=1293975 RepID=A0AA88WUW9_9ASTE|nr:hypothetical protein RJ639_034082 [Escallonia herrerae]
MDLWTVQVKNTTARSPISLLRNPIPNKPGSLNLRKMLSFRAQDFRVSKRRCRSFAVRAMGKKNPHNPDSPSSPVTLNEDRLGGSRGGAHRVQSQRMGVQRRSADEKQHDAWLLFSYIGESCTSDACVEGFRLTKNNSAKSALANHIVKSLIAIVLEYSADVVVR